MLSIRVLESFAKLVGCKMQGAKRFEDKIL